MIEPGPGERRLGPRSAGREIQRQRHGSPRHLPRFRRLRRVCFGEYGLGRGRHACGVDRLRGHRVPRLPALVTRTVEPTPATFAAVAIHRRATGILAGGCPGTRATAGRGATLVAAHPGYDPGRLDRAPTQRRHRTRQPDGKQPAGVFSAGTAAESHRTGPRPLHRCPVGGRSGRRDRRDGLPG